MRIRTRSYAAAFAASAGVISVTTMQQSSDALRSTSRFSMPSLSLNSRSFDFTARTVTSTFTSTSTSNRKRTTNQLCSSRTDADTEQVQRKNYGAPVVDSTLLRFISQQKKVPEVFREAPVVIEDGETVTQQASTDDETSTTSSDSSYDSTTNAIKQKLAKRGNFVEETEDEMGFVYANNLANTSPSSSSTSTSTTTSWMAQFGSNNVAQTILASGDVTDESLAKTAGDAVERYCLVRNARQRIRRFLKERDTLWQSFNNTSRSELESLAAADVATSPSATILLLDESYVDVPSYGLEDVLAIMREYGLTGNDICALLTHSPNLALRVPSQSFRNQETQNAETLEQTLQRSLNGLLLETLGLRKYDARKILRTCPGLLSVRGSKSAVEVVTIMTKLGVSTNSLSNNSNRNSLPVLLSRSPAGLFRLVSFLSSTAVRMPLEQIGPLLRRREGQELMDALLPIPNTSYGSKSSNDNQSNTTDSEVSAAIDDAAATWSQTRMQRQEIIERTYAGMTQTARILKAQIGTQDLTKVVAAYPKVLLLDARNQILPVSRYLMGGLGIWQKELSSVLQLYPTLLGTKIDDLERVVSYMLTLGVDEDDLAGIFRAFPGLFSTKVEDMEAVVSYLESIGVRDIGAFVTKLPSILGYSVEKDLRPKWEFLKTVCLQPEFELKEFPAYFSYPFDRVIKTRFNYLAYKGISIRFVSMRIDTVVRFGDLDFATKVALDDDDGEAYAVFCSQRGSSSANGAAAQKAKRRRNNNNRNRNRRKNTRKRPNETSNLDDLNQIYREAGPVRNKSLGNSLPSLKPTRPKRKQKKQQQNNNSQQARNQPIPKQSKKKNTNRKPRKNGSDDDDTPPSPA